MHRKICLVTGSRAEYGLLQWIASDLQACDDVELQFVVTGSHLEPRLGETWRFIEADGFKINRKVDLRLSADSPLDVAGAMARCLAGTAEAIFDLRPDLLVVLGDRYEILAAVEAALILGVPIAHVHGGEITEGAIDDAIRHAITKLSNLHFASCEAYKNRIIQLGENPSLVWNTGSVALDGFTRFNLMTRTELLDNLSLEPQKNLFLCAFHPETLGDVSPLESVDCLLKVLEEFEDTNFIWTLSNADAGGESINDAVREFVGGKPSRRIAVPSLGQRRYLSALTNADLIVGNSSSGIVEAPAAGTPTVNLGDRQKGRLRSPSIIDCPIELDAIRSGLERALSSEIRDIAREQNSAFGVPGASKKISEILRSHPLDGLTRKKFFDISELQ